MIGKPSRSSLPPCSPHTVGWPGTTNATPPHTGHDQLRGINAITHCITLAARPHVGETGPRTSSRGTAQASRECGRSRSSRCNLTAVPKRGRGQRRVHYVRGNRANWPLGLPCPRLGSSDEAEHACFWRASPTSGAIPVRRRCIALPGHGAAEVHRAGFRPRLAVENPKGRRVQAHRR